MKPNIHCVVLVFLLSLFLSKSIKAQTFGTNASAVWITNCEQDNFFNVSGDASHLIGPSANTFNNANIGAYTQNSGSLILRGGEVKTFKNPGVANVCNVRMYYRVYLQSGVPGPYSSFDLPFFEDCDVPGSQFPSGGACIDGDQKWRRVIADGETIPYSPVDLTTFPVGSYTLEVYYEVTGSFTSTTLCNDVITLNNSGANYKASFAIQSPSMVSTNPTTCNGSEGSILFSGLAPNTTYSISYTDGATLVGPVNLASNGSGQASITGLNAGIYSNFSLIANGCETNLFTGIILSNPVFTPTFNPIAAFCAGTTPPLLPTVSRNGIAGTWSPSVINNQTSGSYTFTPNVGQCALPGTINITVRPTTTPTFSFGTSLTICAGAAVPSLPATSLNGLTGTWSPAVVSNTNSGVYTFTPTSGAICPVATTFTVTVNPNITPTFSFGTTLSVCTGDAVPSLPSTSDNGINGTWSSASIDNQNSATYTFTPTAGQCATTTALTVTVNPILTPAFSIGTSMTVCEGGTVPSLPSVSDNGITGTWNPSVINNQNSGTYTFTPASGQCAIPATFIVTITQQVTPTFSFGTSLSICAGAAVPVLSTTSNNGITGTWTPSVINDQNSGTYTFIPSVGECATIATLTVTVNPIITPAFSFGTSISFCAGAAAPALPIVSLNGISGSWSPAIIDNQNSGTYTFTPSSGQCAVPVNLTVTVNPILTPTFSFGSSLTICANGTVPVLPATSDNGVNGSWNPATVSDQNSGAYTFTPDAGECAVATTFTVTVNPNITPTFSFGTATAICAGSAAPLLPSTSTNGITGTWNPAVIDNQNSGTYTFTPDAGQCALTATLTVTVNPNITPTFSFGTTLSLCAGATAPALPTTSDNGITGTWSPSAIDNQNSGSYTFTPTAGLCATTTTLTVTVNPNITPTFAFGTSLSLCAGATAPALPTTSDNGITGTWNPSIINNQTSGTYTFTPDAGQCAATATFTVTVNPNITPTFSFGTATSICEGNAAPSLPATSTNGITGTWNPAVIDNQTSGTYTFTPDAGQCALTTTLTVAVNPNITPTFAFGTTLSICAGATAPALPTTSDNGITGTWSPSAIDNQNSGSYTFTPTAGLCATTTVLTVTINPIVQPTFSFGSSLTICAGGSVPTLTTTSDNGITGAWSPAIINNQNSGTYTFTPDAGQCAATATFTVTVNPNITPTFSFGTSLSICESSTAPSLPATSTNGITGTWNPAVIDNQNSGTYTFTPAAGQCALTTTLTVNVNPNITPTFAFGTTLSLCASATAPALPTTSDNGITGTWNPSVIDIQNSGSYTFTPTAGLCATTTTLTVTINPIVQPTFGFGSSLTICAGGSVPALTTTSINGITGSWNPAVVDNQSSGVYIFTPDAGQCAATASYSVTVNPNITPTFSFGTSLTICNNGSVPALPATSDNGITGTWSPSVIDNQNSGTYTFTPDAGICAVPTSLTVTVNLIVTPTFSIGTALTICAGATAPALATTSDNGITGTWSPSVIDNQNSGTYTFTPAAGQCATTATFTVTITPNMIPTFTFGNSLTICAGGTVPSLPATSDNGIAGTWNPAVVNNQSSGVYTFTPSGGVCALAVTFTVTVNPILTPAFSFGTTQSICIGATVPALVTTSTNGVAGTWSPAAIDNMVSGTYTFTPDPGQCANKATLTVTVNPIPSVIVNTDTTVFDGDIIPVTDFIETPGAVINWTNSNPAIGLPASGTGNVPSFKATNMGNDPITGTITVTPSIGGCIGASKTYIITVKPLNKDVFVPNVFSPNGDGKNDILYVYGNYITKLEMRVFNQWGEQVALISDKGQGWNGMQRGKPQPVGVYVYVLKAELTGGRNVNMKGSITLLR